MDLNILQLSVNRIEKDQLAGISREKFTRIASTSIRCFENVRGADAEILRARFSLGREHSNATSSIDLCDSRDSLSFPVADYSPETEYRFAVVEFLRQVIRLVDSADNYPTTIINERSISLRTTIAPVLTKLRKLTGRFSFFPSLQGNRTGFYKP